MKIKYTKTIAGVSEGTVRDLPEGLAKQMIAKGYAKAEGASEKKENKPELTTKEEKSTGKRKTKSKK